MSSGDSIYKEQLDNNNGVHTYDTARNISYYEHANGQSHPSPQQPDEPWDHKVNRDSFWPGND